ncbi:MAG: HNH endonuclease signature motif containing protein [Magnetospirillum sp.]
MAKPTEATVRKLFALSGNFCAFAGCNQHVVDPETGVILGEICHIHAKSAGGPRYAPQQSEKERNGYDNLILLCATHHKLVDTRPDKFPAEDLKGMKQVREENFGRKEQAGDEAIAKLLLQVYTDALTVGHVAGDLNVSSTGPVHVKKAVRKVNVAPAPGTIGADQALVRYVEYLIKKYNEYASKDPFSSRKFSHAAIRHTISDKFGGTVKNISAGKAEDLIAYLQERIRKTSIAKANMSKGWRAYSTFDEFQAKYGS